MMRESDYSLFSYGKYLGIEALQTTITRTLPPVRIRSSIGHDDYFMSCCSRAVKDLAVVLFAPNARAALDAVLAKGIFASDDVTFSKTGLKYVSLIS